MQLNSLVKNNKKKIRVGRGIGSGRGKTSTRGHKGQKSHSGIKHTNVKYKEPTVVSLIKIVSIYSAVLSPGLIPGIYPPYFLKFSAVSFGLNTIDV